MMGILLYVLSITYLLMIISISDSIQINFTFPIQRIPNLLLRKTTDPLAWDFHSTYHGTIPAKKASFYNHLVPWPRYFDIIIDNKAMCGTAPCVFQVREISNSTQTIKVLVSNEQHEYFIDTVLPFFEARWNTDKSYIMVFSGNGDPSVTLKNSQIILGSKCVQKWIVSQNKLEVIQADPR